MHRTLTIGRLLLFGCILASCADAPYVVISPAKPKPGETLQITYDHSSPEAVFKGTEPLTAYVLQPLMRKERSFVGSQLDSAGKWEPITQVYFRVVDSVVEVPMSREGSISKASFTLPKEMQSYAFVKFSALGTYDLNKGAAWRLLLHGQNGIPLKSAYADAAQRYLWHSPFGIVNSTDSMLACYRNESALYPGNPMLMYSWKHRWAIDSSESMRTEISIELDSIVQGFRGSRVWSDIPIGWLEKLGRMEEAAALRARYITENPPRDTAFEALTENVLSEEDPIARRAAIIALLNSDSVDDANRWSMCNSMLQMYLLEGIADSALIWYDSLRTPDTETTISLAALCIRDTRYRERGLAVAKSAIDRAFDKDPRGRLLLKQPWPVVSNEFPDEERLLEVYADGMSRAGRSTELRQFCEDAFESLQGSSIMLNTRLAREYFAAKEYSRMFRFVTECLDRDRATDDMINHMRMAYIRAHGSDAGLDDSLSAIRSRLRERTRLRISAQRIDKGPLEGDFTTIGGRKVLLSELRGKVVLLAFWYPDAFSWSQVSRKLEHACARFSDDPDVEIFAINWRGDAPEEERMKYVQKRIASMKCPVQFAINKGFAEQNRIGGMNRTLVIGKNGRIQFQDRLIQNTMMAEEELAAEIEFLLKSDS